MAHAYYFAGENEAGISASYAFASNLGLEVSSPDLVTLQYGLFSVDDARRLADIAHAAPVAGNQKIIIVSLTRFFHEAQNALLKLFEEPPRGVTLILIIPTEGLLLPTLRSRLQILPNTAGAASDMPQLAREFLAVGDAERTKLIDKMLDRTKSDKETEKQKARNDAVLLLEGLMRAADRSLRAAKREAERQELRLFLDDLGHFLPLLHTRSAPLKLIFEHVLLVIPTSLHGDPV